MNKQNNTAASQPLDIKQQAIITIAGYTAKGNLEGLNTALNIGLEAGLSVNEIKEVLVQLYAYCGFPRSLNGLTTFMKVVNDRKAQGIEDVPGKEATPISKTGDKYETGKNTLELLTKTPETRPKTGVNAFAPVIDVFLKEHLFADIFSRDVLTYMQRELATITVLATLEGLEAQLKSHLGMGINVGLTGNQLRQLFDILEPVTGKAQANAGKAVLSSILMSLKDDNL